MVLLGTIAPRALLLHSQDVVRRNSFLQAVTPCVTHVPGMWDWGLGGILEVPLDIGPISRSSLGLIHYDNGIEYLYKYIDDLYY